MLTTITNIALVQIIQFVILLFYVWLVVAAVGARIHLPPTKLEPVWDILLVATLFFYAIGLRIIFST